MAVVSIIAIITVHLFIISKMIFFPYPELFIYPYLTNLGLTPYAQIFDQHFPGVMFLPFNLGNLGMTSTESALALHMGIIIINHILLFLIARSFLNSDKKALIANVFYLLWHPFFEGNVLWIDSIVGLFLLPSFYFFYKYTDKNNTKNLYVSAILIGLALVFKQVVGPLILLLFLILFFVLKQKKKAFIFGVVSAIPILLVLIYFSRLNALNDFIYWTVTYNLTTFSKMGRKFASFSEIIKFIFIFIPAFIYAFYSFSKNKKHLVLLSFLFGSLFFAYARFDWVHLQPALLFLSIIVAALLSKLPKAPRNNLAVIYLLVAIIFVNRNFLANKGNEVRFFGDYEDKLVKAVEPYVEDGDPIFTMAAFQHIYYLTKTRPAGNQFVFHFPWFMVEAEDRILDGLQSDPPLVVVRDATITVQGMNLVEYMPKIDEYISQNYYLESKIGDTEVLLPNE